MRSKVIRESDRMSLPLASATLLRAQPVSVPNTEATDDHRDYVQSVVKACRILQAFTTDHRELTAAELADATGLNKTTVHRLSQTLVLGGLLARSGSRYRLSMRVFRLGAVAQAGSGIRNTAVPILERLAGEFGDTAYLFVPGEDAALCLDLVEGESPIRVASVGIGTLLPYSVAAAPVAMLAFSEKLQERFFRKLDVGALPTLESRLAKIRHDGYAISDQDYLPGVSAVGAPVLDLTGEVVAAVSLGGTSDHFSPDRLQRIIERVVSASVELATELGRE